MAKLRCEKTGHHSFKNSYCIKCGLPFTDCIHVFQKETGACVHCGVFMFVPEEYQEGMPKVFMVMDLSKLSDKSFVTHQEFIQSQWNNSLETGEPMVIGSNTALFYRHDGKYYRLGD